MTGEGNPARDPDGDGLHEDIDGDGTFDIFDVQPFLDRFVESIDWTGVLRRANLIRGVVSAADAVKCEQIVHLYDANTERLDELADTIGSGTIENSGLDEGQVLFVELLRDLQHEMDINPNMNHVKFGALLPGRHRGEGGEELTLPTERPTNADTIERQLQQAKQLVFYGPPGTGRTYTARQFARWWLHQQGAYTPTGSA